MNDLILFPFNGNAREAVPAIEALNNQQKQWNIIGFVDDESSKWGIEFLGYPVLGGREFLQKHSSAKVLAIPGSSDSHLLRKDIINSLNLSKDRFATIVHPYSSIFRDTKIGYNTLVMAGVITTVNVTIGNHCAILPNSVLSHDAIVKDYCLVGSNVTVSGHVTIDEQCYVGSGSRFIQGIEVKEGTLVGIGSVVLKSTDPYSVVVGVPARYLRRNE